MFEANEKSNNAKYGMRAPPRRRIKTEESVDDQPVFLRKAYVMISNCPPEIGGWSEKGDTLVVKDVKQFSERVIPTAYKHNNFSSFVRQLNFYGFRKVKSELLEQSAWWEFRHPQFLRDQPHLLSEIKRSIHYAPNPNGGQEVSDLKSQVDSLTDKIDMLNEQIDALTNTVTLMQMSQQMSQQQEVPAEGGKKRKLTAASAGAKPLPPLAAFSRMCSIDEGRSIAQVGGQQQSFPPVPSGPELRQLDLFRQNSLSGASCVSISDMISEADGGLDWTEELEAAFGLDEYLDVPVTAAPLEQESIPHASAVSATPAGGIQDLFHVLESLAPELKIRFVDKLAEVMGKQLSASLSPAPAEVSAVDPTANKAAGVSAAPSAAAYDKNYNSKLPASSVSSSSSSSEPDSLSPSRSFAQLTTGSDAPFHLPSGARAPEIALPLASAALGAFVMTSLNSLVQNQKEKVHIKSEVV